MWSWTFNFLLALLIFAFNLLVLVAISTDAALHTTTHLLSTNLWLCNCISAIVTIFFSLTPHYVSMEPAYDLTLKQKLNIELQYKTQDALMTSRNTRVGGLEEMSAHSCSILLNSTISFLSLLTMGIVHTLKRQNYQLSSTQSSRLVASTWVLALLLLFADFFLIRLSHSFLLAVPFHLALLAVFLFLNLILHPLNLLLLTKCSNPQQDERERIRLFGECATACLWLLLSTLSFVIITMMALWESRERTDNITNVMGIEMAAYSVHCIANPLIAVIRDRRLEQSLARLLLKTKRQTTEEDLVVALMRDPPPPYS